MKHLWAIEIYGEFGWQPTVGVGKTAEEARKLLDDWLKINTFDSFRIRKYVREHKRGEYSDKRGNKYIKFPNHPIGYCTNEKML